MMEFIDGTKILQLPRRRRPIRSGWREIGFRVLLKMVFEDGFVHADLHPGNIFITRDDRVAILDLGLVGELDDAHRAGFARYFAAWAQGDGKTMARADGRAVARRARSATTPASRRRSSRSSRATTASGSARCRCRWCSWT